MWEVFSEGKIPYENRSNLEVVDDITSGFRLYKPRLASKQVYQIMNLCWKEVGGEKVSPPIGCDVMAGPSSEKGAWSE